ncbi:hypothetical protein [Limosilactobacillus oris]|uniref:hypothetical protein n=1 Tax=Limosilactobacillus oris TaxID=1632 RepID=UPI003209F7E5
MKIYDYKELEKISKSRVLAEKEIDEANKQLLEQAYCGTGVAEIKANDNLPQTAMRTLLKVLERKGYSVKQIMGNLVIQLPFNHQGADDFERK